MSQIDNELEVLHERLKVFRENNNNPMLALANYSGSAEVLKEFFNRMYVDLAAEFTQPYEKYSIVERIFHFLYKLFGAEYKVIDINGLDQYGNGALHYAFGSVEVIKLLVEKCGADVNLPNGVGATAIMKAAEYGMADSVAYLLGKGASTNNVTTDEQKNILHKIAIEFKPRDKAGQLAAIKLLMQSDSSFYDQLNAKDKYGMTPIDYAMKKSEAGHADELVSLFNTKISKDVINSAKPIQGAHTQRVVDKDSNNINKEKILR